MTFTIVQIIEKGRLLLWTVPSCWVNNRKLKYPPSKIDKLRRDPTSIPKDNWKLIDCIVKRNNYSTFESAESANKAMSDVSDTETEIESAVNFPRLTKPTTSHENNRQLDFNYLVLACNKNLTQDSQVNTLAVDADVMIDTAEQPIQGILQDSQVNAPTIEAEVIIDTAEQPIQEFALSEPAGITSGLTSDQFICLQSKIEAMSTNISNIESNQQVLFSNQIAILQKIADISTQFDEFIKQASQSVRIEPSQREVGIVRITDKKSLDEFEECLKSKKTAQDMKKRLSVICGQGGKGKAINNAYSLLDVMFERRFLVTCSWAGGTRDEGNKICFKSYQNTTELFFEIVHMSDKEFTKIECDKFLKNVLRNAKKRSNSQNIRMSHQKKTTIKLKTKENNADGENEYLRHVEEAIDLQNLLKDGHEEIDEENSLC